MKFIHSLTVSIFNYCPLLVSFPFFVKACVIDLHEHRLPNSLVLKSSATGFAGVIISALVLGEPHRIVQASMCALLSFVAMLMLYLLSRQQLGLGDVKFAIPCGMLLGWFAPSDLFTWLWFSFLTAAIVAGCGVLVKRSLKSHAIAFGPFMFLSLCSVIVLSR